MKDIAMIDHAEFSKLGIIHSSMLVAPIYLVSNWPEALEIKTACILIPAEFPATAKLTFSHKKLFKNQKSVKLAVTKKIKMLGIILREGQDRILPRYMKRIFKKSYKANCCHHTLISKMPSSNAVNVLTKKTFNYLRVTQPVIFTLTFDAESSY